MFALLVLGMLLLVVAALAWLGTRAPGSGLDAVGLRSAGEITMARDALEAEDLQQMLLAREARRTARAERAPAVRVGARSAVEMRVARGVDRDDPAGSPIRGRLG